MYCIWMPVFRDIGDTDTTRLTRAGTPSARGTAETLEDVSPSFAVGKIIQPKLGTFQTCGGLVGKIYVGLSPLPVTVTTRIITFLVGDPYKPSFATVTGRGDNPKYM